MECDAPFPVCPECWGVITLPQFAADHPCEVSCHCGYEFWFHQRCGAPAGHLAAMTPQKYVTSPEWRMMPHSVCRPHAAVLTARFPHPSPLVIVTSLS